MRWPQVLAATLLALAPAALAANADPARFEFGVLERGDERTEHVLVTNPSSAAVTILLEPRGDAWATFLDVAPLAFDLAPAAAREVTIALTIPADAAPGRHDLDIQVVERTAGGQGGTGQGGIDVRLVFEVAAADLTYLEWSGDDALAIVDNWLDRGVSGTVEAQWLAPDGEVVGALPSADVSVPSKAREYVTLAQEPPRDATALRARAVLDGEPGPWRTVLLDDGAGLELTRFAVQARGREATLEADVRSPLSSVATFRVGFHILEGSALVEGRESDLTDVEPGSTRTVSWTWRGDPGTYAAQARLLPAAGPAGGWSEASEPFVLKKSAGDTPALGAVASLAATVLAFAAIAAARRRR